MVGARDRGVGGGERYGEVGGQRQASLDELGPEGDELVVPHVEGRELIAADAACLGRLEQSGALLEHAVVVGEHPREARGPLHQELIHEPPAGGRVAADDLEVFRCEQHDLRVPRQLRALDRGAIDPSLVRTLSVQLRFEQNPPLAMREPGADDGGIRTVAHHRRVRRDAMRAERREEGDRLGEIGLALAVAADEHVRTGTERDVGHRVVAEVDEAEVLHDHCATLIRRGDTRWCG